MNLRTKTLLVIGCTLLGLVLIVYLVAHIILVRGFALEAERESTREICRGVSHILDQVLQDFGSRYVDWAAWDDAYRFVQDRNTDFQRSNLNPETFDMLRVNLMVFTNIAGQVVYGSGYDQDRRQRTQLPEGLARHLVAGSPLLRPAASRQSTTGFLLLDEGPMLVTAQPILTSEKKGPCRGVLIAGRFLGPAELERLQRLIHLPLQLERLDRPGLPPDFQSVVRRLGEGRETFTAPLGENTIAGYLLEKDLYGEPALLFRVTSPRVIYQQGRITLLSFLLVLVFTGLVFGGVFLLLLRKIILSPLARLGTAVGAVGEGADLSVSVALPGKDELARLSHGIDGMLDALRKSHERLEQRVRERTARLSESNRLLQLEVAEREHAEKGLAEEKERLAVTLRCIGDGVISTDMNGTVVMMNQVAEQLTGWPGEEAVGQPLDRIFHLVDEATRKSVEQPTVRVLAGGEAIRAMTPALLVARGGTERLIADSCAPIRQRSGAAIGAVIVFRDITEKRRMEAEILKAGRLESLGILAGGIAHDFNNILMGILGNISIAKLRGRPDAELAERLDEAEKASLRARDLTQQLLTFSRGGAPVKKAVAIGDLLREWAAFATRGSKARCEVEIASDLWPVEIDAGQIGQVVHNLVINAVQAMPSGGIIRLRAENDTVEDDRLFPRPRGRYVRIDVVDQGIGIPPEHLPKIFDPFFTMKPQGTGLGLTTSYSIVSKHDGLLTVESQPGTGTAFHLYLPASRRAAEAAPETVPAPHPGRGRILVMDDDEMIRQVLGQMLSGLGYQPEFARDGAEALACFERSRREGRPHDVVIMDLTVPGGMGGKETIQQLRAIDPGVKAIVSSGYCNDPVIAEFNRHGFAAILVKPYQSDELSRVLEAVLSGKGP